MKSKLTLLSVLLITNSYANKYFLELTQGVSLAETSSKFILQNNATSNYLDAYTTLFDARVGYSFYLRKKIYFEPSIGLGSMQSDNKNVNVEPIYSVEIPLLYRTEYFKYGLFVKYNYFPETTLNTMSSSSFYINDSATFKDESSLSTGFKVILVGGIADLVLKGEYLTNPTYTKTFVNNAEATRVEVSLANWYASVGFRIKF